MYATQQHLRNQCDAAQLQFQSQYIDKQIQTSDQLNGLEEIFHFVLLSINLPMQNTATSPTNIDQYIAGYSKNVQTLLQQVRETIKKVVPDAEEAISYGIPTFKLNGNLVHFGGFKQHIGFYPGAGGIKAFEKELAAYKGAKGSVQFPIDQPMPLDIITAITKFRVEQNLAKKLKRK